MRSFFYDRKWNIDWTVRDFRLLLIFSTARADVLNFWPLFLVGLRKQVWSGWRREKYIRYFFFFLIWRCLVRRQKTFLIRRKRTWASFLSNIKKKLLLQGSHVLSQILMMRSHDLLIFLRESRNGNVKLITEVWNPIQEVDSGKWSENCKSYVESGKNLTWADLGRQ